MNADTLHRADIIEQSLVDTVRKALSTDLVSLFVVGSYANYDIVEGYSDYDVLAFVDTPDPAGSQIDFAVLSKKYAVEIKCTVRPLSDFKNRILDNDRATRFVGNLTLLDLKLHARLLYGKDIVSLIPDVRDLLTRDLQSELQAEYTHALDVDKEKNIFVREPRDWCNYVINMCGALLLAVGISARKDTYPELISRHHPEFGGVPYLKEALQLRSTMSVLHVSDTERDNFKNVLALFLDEYRRYTFK